MNNKHREDIVAIDGHSPGNQCIKQILDNHFSLDCTIVISCFLLCTLSNYDTRVQRSGGGERAAAREDKKEERERAVFFFRFDCHFVGSRCSCRVDTQQIY